MKKLFSIIAIATAMFAFASCKDKLTSTAELVYDVTATAEGKVDFTWFNGGASVDGAAKVFQCNDTTKVKGKTVVLLTAASRDGALKLADALQSTDKKTLEAATTVSKALTVKGVEGEYHLRVFGYVKYGPLVFAIDEEYPKTAEVAVE